jgi:hypothetical protein
VNIKDFLGKMCKREFFLNFSLSLHKMIKAGVLIIRKEKTSRPGGMAASDLKCNQFSRMVAGGQGAVQSPYFMFAIVCLLHNPAIYAFSTQEEEMEAKTRG